MKKILFTCVFVSFVIYACFNPGVVVEASKNGILIWFQQILPALLPFTIFSSILLKSRFLDSFKGNSNIIAIVITMVCGFVFGFPIGAKLSSDFYKSKLLTEKQATLLAITTNNFSPMYVCGFALPLLFGTNHYNLLTYLLLYLLPLIGIAVYLIVTYMPESTLLQTSQIIVRLPENNKSDRKKDIYSPIFRLNMQILDESIINGFLSLIKICGYIVFFSILAEICQTIWTNPPFAWNLLLKNLEISNGISLLSQNTYPESIKYILVIQLLSFGGLSGLVQTASLLETSGLSTYKYIIGKVILSLLLTLLSVIYVSCFILQL